MGQVKGCHLVGSVCLPNEESVFRQCSTLMPNRLKRIPDGETGERKDFVQCQLKCFQAAPEMLITYADNSIFEYRSFTPEEISDGIKKLKQAGVETGYDDFAIRSYSVFKQMRNDGVIPKETRFQVSLPAYGNTMGLVQHEFAAAVAPVYEEALLRALRNIQDKIPHSDLAIQIDIAVELMFLENVPFIKPWFHAGEDEEAQRKKYISDYILRMISMVDSDVEVGLHNCYGDMGHRHFKEPESLAAIAENCLSLFQQSPRPINFLHLPVPLSAMDRLAAYYAPLTSILSELREHNTDLYLGLVHYDDLEGTKKRIEAAKKALGDVDFGVATECGWGRTPQGEIENIMNISREVSEPVF